MYMQNKSLFAYKVMGNMSAQERCLNKLAMWPVYMSAYYLELYKKYHHN